MLITLHTVYTHSHTTINAVGVMHRKWNSTYTELAKRETERANRCIISIVIHAFPDNSEITDYFPVYWKFLEVSLSLEKSGIPEISGKVASLINNDPIVGYAYSALRRTVSAQKVSSFAHSFVYLVTSCNYSTIVLL